MQRGAGHGGLGRMPLERTLAGAQDCQLMQ